jgi:hypothetical protein
MEQTGTSRSCLRRPLLRGPSGGLVVAVLLVVIRIVQLAVTGSAHA